VNRPGARQRQIATAVALLGSGAFAFAAAAVDLEAATTETWRLPEPDLYAVDAHGSHAWAAGYWGAILRSADGGESWEHVATPTDESLYDISFADEQNGWAVGEAGTLLHSRDGGRSWRALEVSVPDPFDGTSRPLDASLFGVAGVSATEAWAVGDFGIVLHTLDGDHWKLAPLAEGTYGDENIPDRILNAVHFSDRATGSIAGEFGTALRTSDGGETWIGEREIRGAIDDIYLFDIGSNGSGWSVAGGAGGAAIGTRDDGAVWDVLDVPTTAGLFGVAVAGDRGILVGDRGVLLLSRDAGLSWSEPERPRLFNWLRGAAFGADGLAYVVGERGLILRSSDGGESWERRAGHEPSPEKGVSVPDPGGPTRPTLLEHEQHEQP
jgi:photosystem II stability/assembly factor-like uncharacterized protein